MKTYQIGYQRGGRYEPFRLGAYRDWRQAQLEARRQSLSIGFAVVASAGFRLLMRVLVACEFSGK